MKALCLHQPFATAIYLGLKTNETRSRPWSYVGDVAICAAKFHPKGVPEDAEEAMKLIWHRIAQDYGLRRLMDDMDKGRGFPGMRDLYDMLPRGKVICVVEKTGCVATDTANRTPEPGTPERILGNYDAGRFYYPTKNLRRLSTPVPVKGSQGVFELPAETERFVRLQLGLDDIKDFLNKP